MRRRAFLLIGLSALLSPPRAKGQGTAPILQLWQSAYAPLPTETGTDLAGRTVRLEVVISRADGTYAVASVPHFSDCVQTHRLGRRGSSRRRSTYRPSGGRRWRRRYRGHGRQHTEDEEDGGYNGVFWPYQFDEDKPLSEAKPAPPRLSEAKPAPPPQPATKPAPPCERRAGFWELAIPQPGDRPLMPGDRVQVLGIVGQGSPPLLQGAHLFFVERQGQCIWSALGNGQRMPS